jgi:hypothetical protein
MQMQMNTFNHEVLAFVVAFIFMVFTADGLASGQPHGPSVKLDEAIRKFDPDAKVLTLRDMDVGSCGQLHNDPGVVKADFNGDGWVDYAVLLKRKTDKKTEWKGQALLVIELSFVVFLSEKDGALRPMVLDRSETHMPSIVGLSVRKPGTIREWDSERSIKLQFAGIERFYCEKSAAVFYWNGEKFDQIPISD